MIALRLAATALVAITLGGCSLGKPTPQPKTYVIEPPVAGQPAKPYPQALQIGKFRVAPEFSGRALVYRVDDVRYAADYYSAFLAEPQSLLAGRIADWLDRAGPFQTVIHPGSGLSASFVLDAVFTELYGDFRPGRAPSAVMTAHFTLVDLTGVTPRITLEKTIGRRIPLAGTTPDDLVRGYGIALGEILSELAPQMSPKN